MTSAQGMQRNRHPTSIASAREPVLRNEEGGRGVLVVEMAAEERAISSPVRAANHRTVLFALGGEAQLVASRCRGLLIADDGASALDTMLGTQMTGKRCNGERFLQTEHVVRRRFLSR